MFYYPFSLTAGAPGNVDRFDATASFIRYDEETSGAANNKIKFTTGNGKIFVLKPGQAVKINPPAERIEFQNKDGISALAGTLAFGGVDEEVFDSNVVGSVLASIVMTAAGAPRNDDAAAAAGQAFGSRLTQAAGGPATFATIQLFNPVGSGKRLYVDTWRGYELTVNAGSEIYTFLSNSALTTLDGSVPQSKFGGGAASVAQLRRDTPGGATATNKMDFVNKNAATIQVYERITLKSPVVLDPGWGFNVQMFAAQVGMEVSYEHREY